MTTVRALNSAVNGESATLAQVCAWHDAKAERGEIPASSARFRVTALKKLSSVLGDDESRELPWLLENVESLAKRWGTLNPEAKAGTIRTYESRFKTAIEDYLAWAADPSTFKFRREGREEKDAPPRSARVATPRKAVVEVASGSASAKAPRREGERSFPVGNGGEFTFRLPEGGCSVKDVMKFACHLMTLSEDFDPMAPAQAQIFSMIRKDG